MTMTMSVGLGRIGNDPQATVLTRKALGILSTPGLLVYDDALTIDESGRITLRVKPDGGIAYDKDGLFSVPVAPTYGIDSEIFLTSEEYDRDWNMRLTGDAPSYIENSLAIGAEEFGGETNAFPYDQVEKAKVSITSTQTQLRLRYDMGNHFAARVQSTGFTELFCVGQNDPGLHIITGGGTSVAVQGGLQINFGTTLRRMMSFALSGSFGGGGALGTVSTFEEVFSVTLPAGMSLTSGVNVAFVVPTTNLGGQVMSWSVRIHSSTQIAVLFSYFDVLGALAPTWYVAVFQFL
jgi:hypothetical protein